MSHVQRFLAVASLLALAQCDGPIKAPNPPCTIEYTMTGDSQGNAKFFGPSGEIRSIDVDSSSCTPTVKINMKNSDARVTLDAPTGTCVTRSGGSGTNQVWFDYTSSCECGREWEWVLTGKSPPASIKVKIRPVTTCGPS